MIGKTFCSVAVMLWTCAVANADDIRRVVTGLDQDNKSVVLFDGRLPLLGNRNPQVQLWSTDSSPAGFSFKEDRGVKPFSTPNSISPPDDGTIFRVIEFAPVNPDAISKMDPNLVMKIVGDHAPTRGVPVRHPLMHRTRTMDYAYIISGEIDMMLDESVVHLKAGDVVVQQATNHAWINHGPEPCRILFVLVDSKQP
jgi:mannose-6-phosphate isomerase-like protein (cupin superfamily)